MFWHNVRLLNALAAALAAAAVLALLGAGAWRLANLPMFTLRSVRVQAAGTPAGLRHVNAATIRANINGKFEGNFFTVRLDAVRQAFEAVPWVRRASVRRVWPDGLEVTIEEHLAFGTWGQDDELRLVNPQGEVFVANVDEAEADLPSGSTLVALHGPEGSAREMVAAFRDIVGWFKPLGWKPVELTLSSRYAWTARFDNGTRVEFGRDLAEADRATIAQRAGRFVRSWPQAAARLGVHQPGYADLRYPNGYAIGQGRRDAVDGT